MLSSRGYTPIFRIVKDGQNITNNFEDRALSITIQSYQGGSEGNTLDLALDDRDFEIASPPSDGSSSLQVYLGYEETALFDQGTFSIDEVVYAGPPKTMQIHGNSVGFGTAVKSPVIQSFSDSTVGKIVESIASAAGVPAVVAPALGAIAIPFLNQYSSHLHMLQDLESRFNGLAKFEDGKLSFTERGSGDNASGNFAGGFTLTPDDFGQWNIRESQRHSYSKVRASYWNKDTHELEWLNSAAQGLGNVQVPFMMKRAFASKDEAQKAADAKIAGLNRSRSTGQLTLAKGDPAITGGMAFTIAGMRDGIDGSYTVTLATHSYTKETGIVTTLNFATTGTAESFTDQIADGESLDYSGVPASVGPGGIGHQ